MVFKKLLEKSYWAFTLDPNLALCALTLCSAILNLPSLKICSSRTKNRILVFRSMNNIDLMATLNLFKLVVNKASLRFLSTGSVQVVDWLDVIMQLTNCYKFVGTTCYMQPYVFKD